MFQVGDTVIVKENFNEIRWRGDPGIVDEMLDCRGEEFKIERIIDKQLYKIENIRWTWHEKWLEPAINVKEIDESEILSILE